MPPILSRSYPRRAPRPGPVSTRSAVRAATLLGSTALFFALSMGTAMADTLSGTVSYRERMALPATARLSVALVDVSRMDAPADTLALIEIATDGKQVPIPFRLEYDPALIVAGHSYALQARIGVDGQVWFLNTTHHPAFTSATDAPNTDIIVTRVPASPPKSPDAPTGPEISADSPTGAWLAEDINGAGVIDRLQTTLTLTPDGHASGSGGCNRFTGTSTLKDDKISFGPLASTMMACPPATMDQEQKFFKALASVKSWRVDPAQRKLHLLDSDGKTVLRFASQ